MVSLSSSLILIIVVIAAIALAGCAASTGSSGNNTTSSQMVVSTVNTGPVETPQATPVPLPTVTATPTPTPVPPTITIANVNITGTVDSGNPEYANRHDTATFTITNTGGATLQSLLIVYEVDTNQTFVSNSGTSSNIVPQYTNTTVGTFNPGDSKDLTITAPLYPAMVNANVTIWATWKGGSMILYNKMLYPNFSGGIDPADAAALDEYGSANNP
jgi:hypothetical protein